MLEWISQHGFELVNAIGSLATFGAFLFLFIKDKNKEDQIKKLTKISKDIHTHNEILSKQNELFSQQVQVLQNAVIDQISINAIEKEHKDLERKKTKLNVKPGIICPGPNIEGSSGILNLPIYNEGNDAVILKVSITQKNIQFTSLETPFELRNGKLFTLAGKCEKREDMQNSIYKVKILLKDSLDHEYSFSLSGRGDKILEAIMSEKK